MATREGTYLGAVFDPTRRIPLEFWNPDPRSTLITGSAGRGKFRYLIAQNIIRWRGHLFVLDPKLEACFATYEARRKLGPTFVVCPRPDKLGRNASLLPPLARWNPIMEALLTKDWMWVANTSVLSAGDQPHFPETARLLYAGLIDYAMKTDPVNATPMACLELLKTPEAKPKSAPKDFRTWDDVLDDMYKMGGEARDAAAQFLVKNKLDSLADVKSTLLTQLGAMLHSPHVRDSMSGHDFTYQSFAEGGPPITVYYGMPESVMAKEMRTTRLHVSALYDALLQGPGELPRRAILDELGNAFGPRGKPSPDGTDVEPIQRIITGCTMGRSAGFNALMFFQDRQQCEKTFGEGNTSTVAGSCASTVYFKPNRSDLITTDHVVKLAGQIELTSMKRSATTGTSFSEGKQSSNSNTTISYDPKTEALLRPFDLWSLPDNAMLVFKDKKANLLMTFGVDYEDPRLGIAYKFSPNPYRIGFKWPAQIETTKVSTPQTLAIETANWPFPRNAANNPSIGLPPPDSTE